MRIGLERTGGFAGTTVRVVVETRELADGERWEQLAAASRDQSLSRPAPSAVPDGFAYVLQLGDQCQHCTEADLSGARADLVEQLLTHRRTARRGAGTGGPGQGPAGTGDAGQGASTGDTPSAAADSAAHAPDGPVRRRVQGAPDPSEAASGPAASPPGSYPAV